MERDLKLDTGDLCNIIDDYIGMQIDLVHGEYSASSVANDDLEESASHVDSEISVAHTDRHRSIES